MATIPPSQPRSPGGFMDSQELADRWGMSVRWVQQQARLGAIPALRLGHVWRHPRNQIDTYERGEWTGGSSPLDRS